VDRELVPDPTAGVRSPPRPIDWAYQIKRRPGALKNAPDLPPYLLLPEVRALLQSILHANTRLLFATLWHTGPQISEALALTRSSFAITNDRAEVLFKPRGRAVRGVATGRLVPITDTAYIDQLNTYFAAHRPTPGERLFPFTRQAADQRLRTAVAAFAAAGGELPIPISCQTFRHSFAVNCVLHGAPLPVLQQWLGHRHINNTVVYTKVLPPDTAPIMKSIEF
jgi:integrase